MGLPEQAVPPRQGERWLGQQKNQVCEPLLLWPERPDLSHRDRRRLSDTGDHPTDQRIGLSSGMHTGPGRPKDGETHPGRRPVGPGLASNTGAVSR